MNLRRAIGTTKPTSRHSLRRIKLRRPPLELWPRFCKGRQYATKRRSASFVQHGRLEIKSQARMTLSTRTGRARPRALDGASLASFGFLRSGRAKNASFSERFRHPNDPPVSPASMGTKSGKKMPFGVKFTRLPELSGSYSQFSRHPPDHTYT